MTNDPWNYVTEFEKLLSEYTGAPYVITTDCATHAIELCLRYLNPTSHPIPVPKHTYLSIPMMIEKIGGKIAFMDDQWERYYQFGPYPVIDGSVHFEERCYVHGTFYCVSFQHKKRLNLGRGGAILLDNEEAYHILKMMRYDGRTMPSAWPTDPVYVMGYHYYMTPEQAQKGIEDLRSGNLKPYEPKSYKDYPDLTTFPIFRRYNLNDKEHNGYHDFLYAWKPATGDLYEIFVGTDGTTAIENTFNVPRDTATGRKGPYLSSILYQIYRIQKEVINNFTDEIYFFSVNRNDYMKNAKISQVFPDLKSVKIFEIEVQWGKIYPEGADIEVPAIRDYFVENENSKLKYQNLENINELAKNNPNLDVTYFVCETGLEHLDQEYINGLNFKVKTFNFFLLTQVLEYSEYIKDPKYPYEVLNGEYNPYVKMIEARKGGKQYRILNLNRRPDYHRHLLAQTMLSKFDHAQDRIRVTWISEDVKGYKDHPLNNGKSEYFNFEQHFLPVLTEDETAHFKNGEKILRSKELVYDKDFRHNDSNLRFSSAVANYINVGFEIVSESIYFGPLGDVSEKSLRPIVLGVPFIIFGGPNSFDILRKLGLKSYDQIIGYDDTIRNNVERFRSLVPFLDKLSSLSDDEFQTYMDDLHEKCRPIIEHNQTMFKSKLVVKKFIEWIKEIHQ